LWLIFFFNSNTGNTLKICWNIFDSKTFNQEHAFDFSHVEPRRLFSDETFLKKWRKLHI
jgi:hypothetical protein